MNRPAHGMPSLQSLAWLQGAVIVVLMVLLLRGHEPVSGDAKDPADASAATSMSPAAVGNASAGEPRVQAEAAIAPGPAAAQEPDGTVLFGRVTDEAGQLVEGCNMTFTREGESKRLATGGSLFAVSGLQPGRLLVRARATGYRELSETIEIPPDTPRLRRDLVMQQSWSLLVKILTPEGRPLHEVLQELGKTRPGLLRCEVSVIATAFQPDGDFPSTEPREASFGLGRWRSATGIGAMHSGPKLQKEYAGLLELEQRRPLWVSAVLRHRLLATTAIEPGQAEVTLTVQPERILADLGTIRLRVVDDTGSPVSEARVGFSDAQGFGGGELVNAQGVAEVRDLRPGLLQMDVMARDRYAPRALVLLAPAQTMDLGDVAVLSYRVIKGRCENRDEKGGEHSLYAWALDNTSSPELQPTPFRGEVAADGTFAFHMPEGRYFVRASGAGGASVTVDTRTLGDEPLVLRLQKEGAIRLDCRTGGELFRVTIVGGDGRNLFQRWVQDGWKFPLAALPGDYRVEVQDRAGKVTTSTLHLGIEGVDLRVPR